MRSSYDFSDLLIVVIPAKLLILLVRLFVRALGGLEDLHGLAASHSTMRKVLHHADAQSIAWPLLIPWR